MNLSPVVTASPAPPPADVSRSGDSAPTGEFSSVLSQQQGQIQERNAATTQAIPRTSQAAAEERETPVPDETLALLVAGASLPLMRDHVALTNEPGRARGAHAQGNEALTGRTMTIRGAADAARSLQTEARTLVNSAVDIRSNAMGMTPTDRPVPPVSTHAGQSIVLTTAGSDARTGPARQHNVLTPGANAAQLAATRTTSKLDAAQATFTQIASAVGLNTQPVTMTASPAMDNRAMQDAVLALGGAAQATGTDTTLLAAQARSPAVATPLSHPAWAADFSRQFVSMTQGRDMSQPHMIELRLDPPALGPVRITMHISDSIAQAAFISPHAVVRQAIENALPQLQQQLADAGLSLGQANVSDQQPGQHGFEQQASSQGMRNQSVFSMEGDATSGHSPEVATTRQAPRSPDALVDTFA